MKDKTTIKFNWNGQSLKEINRKAMVQMFKMAYDIESRATLNAPVLTSALKNSIRTEENGFTIFIKAGGVVATGNRGAKYVDYAEKREKGPNRDPRTEHYMENAMKFVMQGDYLKTYFGDIAK